MAEIILTEVQQKFYQAIRSFGLFNDNFYNKANPDVEEAKIDPLAHYIVVGEKEGRFPNPLFDPRWYYEQVKAMPLGMNLLVHYATVGDKQGLQPYVGFDPLHVREQLPNRPESTLRLHQLAKEFGRWLSPNRFFDYSYYLGSNPDLSGLDIDPYIHFVQYGADENRIPCREFSWNYMRERFNLRGSNSTVYRRLMLNWRSLEWENVSGDSSVKILQDQVRINHAKSENYQGLTPPKSPWLRRKIDIFAFYLPQFHRIAENEEWWGAGFTEWHNVVRGVPRFDGHWQPRVPGALGFYDLSQPGVMEAQANLARQSGITGFAFYYYNFGNKRLLERPLNYYLENPSVDIQHFLIWANETWSRRWDGSESEILIDQTYPSTMPAELAADFARHFEDARYRRIDGRPLLVIYRAAMLPSGFVDKLRAACRKAGHNPLIYMAQTFEDQDPGIYGLDGAMEFPPHKHSAQLPTISPGRVFADNSSLKIYDYKDFLKFSAAEGAEDYPVIRSCFPSWDNDGRKQGASSVVHGSSPALFGTWLRQIIESTEAAIEVGAPNIACVNAWNEWGEGAYLEPDRRMGYAYLNAVKDVMHPAWRGSYNKILLVGHDAFVGGAQRLLLSICKSMQASGIDARVLLLRADPGYDGLLEAYREAGRVYVVDQTNSIEAILSDLNAEGFTKALVNTSAAAAGLVALQEGKFNSVVLVHELDKMFEQCGGSAAINGALRSITSLVAPTEQISRMLAKKTKIEPSRIQIAAQGQYKAVSVTPRRAAVARLREKLGNNDAKRFVCNVGYADTRKGADLFVKACEILAKERGFDDVAFIWQGDWDPALRDKLAARIARLETAGRLLLLPNNEDVSDTLSSADVFALTSREDPLPSVGLEAWSCGVPVVAFAGAGGISELIEREPILGKLAARVDATALVEQLSATLTTQERADQVARRKAWVAAHHNWDSYVQALKRLVYQTRDVEVAILGYNHGKYVNQRVSSLLEQPYPIKKIRYYDAGSAAPQVGKIMEACKKLGNVEVVQCEPNGGRLYQTWLEIAKSGDSEFLHIAEGDDFVDPGFVEKLAFVLQQDSNMAAAFCAVRWVSDSGKVINDSLDAFVRDAIGPHALVDGLIKPGSDAAEALLIKNPILSMSSVIWRREALLSCIERAAAKMAKVKFAYDWVLYNEILNNGHTIGYWDEVLCNHRQHSASMSSKDDMSKHSREMKAFFELYPTSSAKVARERENYLGSIK